MIERIVGRRKFSSRRLMRRQRGAVLIAVLVCLLIVTMILGSMLQGTLRARRQLHKERDLCQTEFLLQAGADRAMFRLGSEPDYRGETWILPAEAITGGKDLSQSESSTPAAPSSRGAVPDMGIGSSDGQVAIEVSRDPAAQRWQVHIVAEYGLGSPWSIQRTRTFLVPTHLPLGQE